MAKEKINYEKLVKELRRKLIKHEKTDWKNGDDLGDRCYKRGHSECASHFIQLIDNWENGIYNEKNF